MDLQGAIFGDGHDTVGKFKINGLWIEGGYVEFTKQYLGAHAVIYRGLSDGKNIDGTWEIQGNCDGTYNINMECQAWKGWYKQKDFKDKMDLDMVVHKDGVFGTGMDTIGRFVIRGYHDPKQACVSFIKQYLGAHAVHYNGSIYVKDGMRHVKGVWVIPNNSRGKFKLKEE